MIRFKTLKTRYLWLGFLLSLVLGVLLIWKINEVDNSEPLLFLLVVIFVLMAMFLQAAMYRIIRFKPKERIYPKLEYNIDFSKIREALRKENFTTRTMPFGTSYIKIIGEVAYKVVLIENSSEYFKEGSSNSKAPATKGIDKCTKFIGFEIFKECTEEIIRKTPEFSFHGDNMIYQGFYYNEETGILTEPNALKIKEEFYEIYYYLKNLIGLEKLDA